MVKEYSFIAFLIKHCLIISITWIIFLSAFSFVFKLLNSNSVILFFLIPFILSVLILLFGFLELYYQSEPTVKLNAIVKWFYYVVFALSLLFSTYHIQHSLGYLFVIFLAILLLSLFFTPFLAFRFYFAILLLIILAYIIANVVYNFQDVWILLGFILITISIYSFLRYAILDIDGIILKLCELFRKLGYDIYNSKLLLGFRSFSIKFLILYGYLKDVYKLDSVLKAYVDVKPLVEMLDILSKFSKMKKFEELKKFLSQYPPQIKDIRNIMVHGANLIKYGSKGLSRLNSTQQVMVRRAARFLHRIYLLEIYPLYLYLFRQIKSEIEKNVPQKT